MSERIRIMMVDDEPDIPAVLKPILQVEYDVVVAVNGLDALLKLPRYQPDLLIVDLMMPLMDGWELAANVRRNEDFRDIPIIFLTALDSRDDIRRGYESGANVYMTKPFDPDRVLRNVKVFVERDGLAPRPKTLSMQDITREEMEANGGPRPVAAPPPARAPEKRPLTKTHTQKAAESAGAAGPSAAAAAAPAPPAPAPAPAAPPAPRPAAAGPPSTSWKSLVPHPGPQSPLARFVMPPRVLVVDDDPDIVEAIRISLESGFEVVTAFDGLEALRRIPECEPDLYVIDGMMPKMSGFQALQTLRACPDTRHQPVLFISAKADPRDREYARSLGANDFLAKPFSPAALVERLTALVAAPGFQVNLRKRKTLGQILLEEGKKKAEEEDRRRRLVTSHTQRVLDEFLQKYGDQDPYGRRGGASEPPPSDKR